MPLRLAPFLAYLRRKSAFLSGGSLPQRNACMQLLMAYLAALPLEPQQLLPESILALLQPRAAGRAPVPTFQDFPLSGAV